MALILCLDEEPRSNAVLAAYLKEMGHTAIIVGTMAEALQQLRAESIDLVISDYAMRGLTALDVLRVLREQQFDVPLVILTAFATIDQAVGAIKLGAFHFLSKPLDYTALEAVVTQAVEMHRLRQEVHRVRSRTARGDDGQELIGTSAAAQRMLRTITSVAPSKATVLVQGESGTGKELVAQALHALSDRRNGPFVCINCAAIPDGLIESALFGHEKGAFTGALRQAAGAFERAHGGTLLLDEISEMRLDLQAKLLRVLQEFAFERVGGTRTIHVDVRVIATTNRDLAKEAREGRFRQDLYYRLNGVPVHVPPLRERRDDIAVLAMHFLMRAAADLQKRIEGIDRTAMAMLQQYNWPGNVRELQHAVVRAVILSSGLVLTAPLFAGLTDGDPAEMIPDIVPFGLPVPGPRLTLENLDLAEAERRCIAAALNATGGNRTQAARLLGISLRTLRRKLNETHDDVIVMHAPRVMPSRSS